MQMNFNQQGYGTPSQVTAQLNAYQGAIVPNSPEYASIEQRKRMLSGNMDERGYGTPSQITAELNHYESLLDPNSPEYASIEQRKQALRGLGTPSNQLGMLGTIVSMTMTLLKSLLGLMGNRS